MAQWPTVDLGVSDSVDLGTNDDPSRGIAFMVTLSARYDAIGHGYSSTRRKDPELGIGSSRHRSPRYRSGALDNDAR